MPLSPGNKKPRAIIVAGFHRSGTSLAAQMLHLAGIPMALKLFGANISNTDGHFEDHVAMKMHTTLLASQQTSWQHYEEHLLTNTRDTYSRLNEYIKQRESLIEANDLWALKDPRASLFLSPWKHCLKGHGRFVFIYRHWSACIQSLYNRHSRVIAHNLPSGTNLEKEIIFWQQPELAARMWLKYNRLNIDFIEKNPDLSLLVPHAALIHGVDLIKAINNKFSLNIAPIKSSPVKPEMTSSTVDDIAIDGLPEELVIELDQVHLKLATLTQEPYAKFKPEIIEKKFEREQLKCLLRKCKNFAKVVKEETIASISKKVSNNIKNLIEELDSLSFDEILNKLGTSEATATELLSQQAMPLALKLEQLRPFHPASQLWLGRLYLKQKIYDKAEFHFKRAIAIDQSSSFVFTCIAGLYHETKRFSEAQHFYRKSINIDPECKWGVYRLGSLYQEQNLYEQAEKCFVEAVSLDEENPTFQLALIDCYIQQEDLSRAMKIAEYYWEKFHHIKLGRRLFKIALNMKGTEGSNIYEKVIKEHLSAEQIETWLQQQAGVFGSIENKEALNMLLTYLLEHWTKLLPTIYLERAELETGIKTV